MFTDEEVAEFGTMGILCILVAMMGALIKEGETAIILLLLLRIECPDVLTAVLTELGHSVVATGLDSFSGFLSGDVFAQPHLTLRTVRHSSFNDSTSVSFSGSKN